MPGLHVRRMGTRLTTIGSVRTRTETGSAR